ncbi:MAG: hypothetical protein WD468_08620 [Pirellulales bacterium]
MESSRQIAAAAESADEPSHKGSTLSKPLAPEEVRKDEFVTLLHETAEVPSFFWCCDNTLLTPEEPVRIRFIASTCGIPLKVKSVCLPFVLVKHPTGVQRSLDLRKCRVARLTKRYATRAWKAYKKAKPKSDVRL